MTDIPDRSLVSIPARGEWLPLAAVAVQAALLALVVAGFQIESGALARIASLAAGGFVIHALLGARWRLPFFVLLSLAGIFWVMGPVNAGWLVGLGLMLIGIAHLPWSLWSRSLLLIGVGAALAVARGGVVEVPWSAAVWPIFGSMFMFRLIVYLYDLQHEKVPPTPARTLAYFFMLPNVCFPLFPVIDYKTFRRTHLDAPLAEISQNGIRWMLRGLVQLLLYRWVYYHWTLAPADVVDGSSFARFVLSNYLLYLRVSGQFHFVVGVLQLFGFHLPETHHRYYLASSFNDYWRRINIYWKDFMMKLFYYPLFFRLRRHGTTFALLLSTFAVFIATWLLHSYQWFWLRGSFPIYWQDVLFWGFLGALVVANTLWEARHGRRRTLGARRVSATELLLRGLRSIGTFAVIAVLWSLWTSDSVPEWTSMVQAAGRGSITSAWWVLPVLLGLGLLAVLEEVGPFGAKEVPVWRRILATGAPALALALLTMPGLRDRLPERVSRVVTDLSEARLSGQDAALLERGYYEQLMRVDRFNSQLWQLFGEQEPEEAGFTESDAFVWSDTFLAVAAKPDFEVLYLGQPFSTNRWGMRDRDYDKAKPPDTVRLALLGSSHVMGHGVGDGETFEARVEERLNHELGTPTRSYQILNFAIASYSPLQQREVLEGALEFAPDTVLFVGHSEDLKQAISHLAERASQGVELPPELAEMVAEAGVEAGAPVQDAERRLREHGRELMLWAYGGVVQRCREVGVEPVFVFLPKIKEYVGPRVAAGLVELAAEAGFEMVSLQGVYNSSPMGTIQVSPRDHHPNAEGHRLVADRLFRELADRPRILASRAPENAESLR